jgi:hypothetical protein
MNVQDRPAISSLNDFAEKLAPEYRSELYDTVKKFHAIGVGQGVMLGAKITPAFAPPAAPASGHSADEEIQNYLEQKIRECESADEAKAL